MRKHNDLTIDGAIEEAKKSYKKKDISYAVALLHKAHEVSPQNKNIKKLLKKIKKEYPFHAALLIITEPTNNIRANLSDTINKGNYEQAKKICLSLLSTYPNSFFLYFIYGTAFYKTNNYAEAIKNLKKAYKLYPLSPEVCINLSLALEKNKNTDEIFSITTKALKNNPKNSTLLVLHGKSLIDAGKINEAIKYFNQSIQCNKKELSAHYYLSLYDKYTYESQHHIILEKLVIETNEKSENYELLLYSLANIYEKLGEYKKSFSYYEKGNSIKKKNFKTYNIKNDKDYFLKIREKWQSIEDKKQEIIENNEKIKPIFILGMMRSGTTLIEQILSCHSRVHAAGELWYIKEFVKEEVLKEGFGIDSLNIIKKKYLKELSKLQTNKKIITDKMPDNFIHIGLILQCFPSAKIIHLVRDPRAICWSIYKTNFTSNINHGYAYDMNDLAKFYNLYNDQMEFWLEKYNNILNVNYEELTKYPKNTIKNLLEYCELDWQDNCLNFHESKSNVYTASKAQVRQKMYTGSSEKWKNYKPFLEPLLTELAH